MFWDPINAGELSIATWLKAYAEGKFPIRALLADPKNPKTSNHGFVMYR